MTLKVWLPALAGRMWLPAKSASHSSAARSLPAEAGSHTCQSAVRARLAGDV